MTQSNLILRELLAIFSLALLISCQGQKEVQIDSEQPSLSNSETYLAQYDIAITDLPYFAKPCKASIYPEYSDYINDYITDMIEDRKGNIWFGTRYNGLARHTDSTLTYFTEGLGMASDVVNGITEDKQGNIWVATLKGVSKLTTVTDGSELNTNIKNYSVNEGLADNEVWCIFTDSQGNIWTGSTNGVSRFNGKAFTAFPLPESKISPKYFNISQGLIRSITEDKQGHIWIGTDGNGAYRFDPETNTFKNFTHADGLCNNSIADIYADNSGRLWFASRQTRVPESTGSFKYIDSNDSGLSVYDGEKFTAYRDTIGLFGQDLGPIYEDSKGTIWVGSPHLGLYMFDGTTFDSYMDNDGQSPFSYTSTILEDKKGILWLGMSHGLYKIEGGEFINVKRKNNSQGC